LNSIKSVFTIGDLESLTGISAHTIRVWEKRYNLLSPIRTDTNLRRYTNDDLRKLLNIAALQKHGEKIARLSRMSDDELKQRVEELYEPDDEILPSLNAFKLAMVEFDREIFNQAYSRLETHLSFLDIFRKFLVPLLREMGKLWQAGHICPAHEHFISNLIRQKIYYQMELLSSAKSDNDDQQVYVLFLPSNEMHELGILFFQYLLLSKGKNTIYLGQSVELADLYTMRNALDSRILYISWWTVKPDKAEIEDYATEFSQKILKPGDQLWLTGNHPSIALIDKQFQGISAFTHPADMVKVLFDQICPA